MEATPLPAFLAAQFERLGADAVFGPHGVERAPAGPGAYLLALRVERPVAAPARLGGAVVAPGWYLYCGSARGPGGLRARIARHMRKDKTVRWHVDYLTVAATVYAAVFGAASECGLVDALSGTPGFEAPVPGFGSSDCRRCVSHLLRYSVAL